MTGMTIGLEFRYRLLRLRRSSLHNDNMFDGMRMLKSLKMMEQKGNKLITSIRGHEVRCA